MGIGKGTGKGGKREGAGRKPSPYKLVRVKLYLREYENDAAHFLAVDQDKTFSRCVADLIMSAYRQRTANGE